MEASDALEGGRPILVLYLVTAFLNAALLFIIEPMITKMVLPYAGGSPAVWNTSVLFFQISLLLGYLYAHFVTSWLGATRHAAVHLLLLLAGVLFLPVSIRADWFTVQASNPATTVFSVLACSIGVPFFVLSAGAPLLQRWFSQVRHPSARDPYFFYAASNLGSMVGLVAYPLLLERWLPLRQQTGFWLFGYLALVCSMAGCIILFVRDRSEPTSTSTHASILLTENSSTNTVNVNKIIIARRLRWLCWSFVPSSLLLGVTSHITSDIASVPLFWVLPLAIYLLAYVIAFARDRWATHESLVRRQGFLLLAAILTVFLQATNPIAIILPLHLLAFFATGLVCHGQLAKDRPDATRLTEFYLWISLGGVLGGLFNAILAPKLFSSVLEYPLAMTAAAFLRPYIGNARRDGWNRSLDFLLPVVLFLVLVSLTWFADALRMPRLNAQLLSFAIPGVICLGFAYRPIRFGFGMGALLLGSLIAYHPLGKTLYQARSFFGIYRVVDEDGASRHLLFHGTTAHGAQNLKSPLQPISYYHRTGPAGRVLRATAQIRPKANIAIVGLGSGALACYGSATQKFTFFEIDPLVEKIAKDGRFFSYLRDCPPKIEVVIGDARLSLANAPNGHYDLVILDAFSSDVIPTHLLTLEAINLYLAKIAEDGIVLVHISNRYMDLAPIFDRLAQTLNLVAYLRNDFDVTPEERNEGKAASRWIVMARNGETLGPFIDRGWQPIKGQFDGQLWTDDFTDVLRIIRWR